MIPENKQSKKARRERNKAKRVTWNFSPVSRVKESGKRYNRKREKKNAAREAAE